MPDKEDEQENRMKGLLAMMFRHKKIIRNEEGAIDLASIMVGIIVIGMVGGVVAATVFTIIPWSQDNAAKQQLDSVVAAQSAYMGLSSGVPPEVPEGGLANSYADSSALQSANLLKTDDSYCVVTTNGGKGYKAFTKSSSGQFWAVSSGSSKPVKTGQGVIPSDCSALFEEDPTPTLTTMTYKCDTTGSVTLPILNGKGTAKWSDGSTSSHTGTQLISKELSADISYTVTFDGTYTKMDYQNLTGAECLRSLDHWGQKTGITDASFAFYNAKNLIDIPENLPSSVTLAGNMFHAATSLNDPDISYWNVSNVQQMQRMFKNTYKFNQPLNDWNVSKVTNMSGMFDSAITFNQPLENWDMSNVIATNGMFVGGHKFNQPLNEWDVSKVNNFEHMFGGAVVFNQPLDKWDVSKATNVYRMFQNAESFQQNLSGWNTTAVKDGTSFVPASFPNEFMPAKTQK